MGNLTSRRRLMRREDTFMTCLLKVKSPQQGWQRSVRSLLKNCKGIRFQMDGNGMVEVSGIADADRLLWKIGRSSTIELQWVQFGQCSTNLYMNDQPPPKENPNPNSNPRAYGYGYGKGGRYPYHYQPLPTPPQPRYLPPY